MLIVYTLQVHVMDKGFYFTGLVSYFPCQFWKNDQKMKKLNPWSNQWFVIYELDT